MTLTLPSLENCPGKQAINTLLVDCCTNYVECIDTPVVMSRSNSSVDFNLNPAPSVI